MNMIFDDAASSGAKSMIARLRLVGSLAKVRKDILALGTGAGNIVQRLQLVKEALSLRDQLGALDAEVEQVKLPETESELQRNDEPGEPLQSPRRNTAGLYAFHEKRTKGQRQKANDAAIALLSSVNSGETSRDDLTDADREVLAGYSGNGGALIGADGKKGSAYEYYTPKPIAEGIWGALEEMGFSGGKILDPCAGVGVFGATAPLNSAVDAVELDETSGGINALVNDSDSYSTTVSPFESVAANTPDEIYDAVVSNVPFGTVADRGGNQLADPKYQNETLEAYFILRSLDKLKPGGLAAFVVPPRCMSGRGGSEAKLRQRASIKAEFLGAYRLPNSVFGAANADTITDVIFFRKYSNDAAEKISELQEQNPGLLSDANVVWQSFTEGKYFTGEGKRFVMGEFVPKDPDKFRDVDRVKNPAAIPDIAKMLRKLPGSRIDWDALETAETLPIQYREGDTITQAGQTLELQNGEWRVIERADDNGDMARLLNKCRDAYSAFEAGVTLEQAAQLQGYMADQSRFADIPSWLAATHFTFKKLDSGTAENAWLPALVGLAVAQVLDEQGRSSGTDFLATYPDLTAAMKKQATVARKISGKLDGEPKRGVGELLAHYSKRTYSGVWRGDVQSDIQRDIGGQAGFDGLVYKNQSAFVAIDDAKGLMGSDFDFHGSDDWCISAAGDQVCRADDYYTGNYAEFLKKLDSEIQQAPNDEVKQKLTRQRLTAESRLDKVDVSKISFNLFSPYVTAEEKAEFLRRYIHPGAVVSFNESTGDQEITFDIPGSKLTDKEKLIRRMGAYLKNGTITLGGSKLDMKDADGLAELRKMVNTANEQFNGWAQSNRGIAERLDARSNDPEKLRFRQTEDESPLSIPGMNPELELHGYQNAYVRQMGRDFSGINGFGTGLGKTFTALASVQYVQSVGAKKKTLFVVPNSVLSNWRKETEKAYNSTDDCLFVGLRVDSKGTAKVSSGSYDEDLVRVMENRHSKIFVTMEAFERIRLRDDTINKYEDYMRSVDSSFAEQESKKDDERTKGKAKGILGILGGKSGSAPYLEDMGIDSLVVDEAHVFKNSSETVDFKGGKYLSVSPASKRGLDAQAKAWLIRGDSSRGDGVMLLSATPVTNSPLEIYSMMSLAVGHSRVNDLCVGVTGADAFMNATCRIENEDDESLDGQVRAINVFKGLNNTDLLAGALSQVATIKSAEDVGGQLVVPDAPEVPSPVALPPETVALLQEYKNAYRFAADELAERGENRGDIDAFNRVSERTGEPLELVGHPFNLINKMTMLIADPDLDRRVSRFAVDASQSEQAQTLVDQWNSKKATEDRSRPGPNATEEEAVSSKAIRNADKEVVGHSYKMPVKAWIEGDSILIDSVEPSTQEKFEKMAAKASLELDVSVPPKLAAMLENIQSESSNPVGVDAEGDKIPFAKQLIFCDLLGMHGKIKRLLSSRAGIPESSIAVVTGQSNNKPDEILDVQDGFNAAGEDNKYRVIIANEKAEVGINLQKGTQAIHHLTIGWTPDSLTQRNGRGVRQGNKTERVTVYHYDADGTFDTAKRTLVNNKASWIDSLMSGDNDGSIDISGGLSREQMDALIDAIGDTDAVNRLQTAMAEKETASRARTNRERQVINLDTVETQNQFLSQNERPEDWVAGYFGQLMTVMGQVEKLRKRLSNPKMSETARAKAEALLSEQEAKLQGIERQINEAATLSEAEYNYQTQERRIREGSEPLSPRDIVKKFLSSAKRGENRPGDLVSAVRRGRNGYSSMVMEVDEDSELANEWQSEVDMAQSLKDKAVSSYRQQAKADGAMPEALADAFASGSGFTFGGVQLMPGCFVINGEDWHLVATERQARYMKDGRDSFDMLYRVMPGDEIAYPGSARHEELTRAAAAMEDDAERSGRTTQHFSEILPEVAQNRETDVMAAYSSGSYHLPSPYFPIPVQPLWADKSALLKSLFDKQAEIIVRWEGRSFVVPSSVDVVPAQGLLGDLLVQHCKANNLQVASKDFDAAGLIYTLPSLLGGELEIAGIDGDALEEEVKLHATGAEFRAAVAEKVRAAAPWFAFDGDEIDYMRAMTRARFNSLESALVLRNDPDAAAEAPAAPKIKPEEVVYIAGDTWEWKDRIKEYGARFGDSSHAPKRGYRWVKSELAWSVQHQAWLKLIEDHPKAAEVLKLKEL